MLVPKSSRLLGNGKPVRPYHIGSGVSFAIGVLVSCLSAHPDDIVVIENPEIHLHPKAQSELTEFLCFVANAGIQVILATFLFYHSNNLELINYHLPRNNLSYIQ